MESTTSASFPQGIEIIVSALICNENNEILLVRQPKWGDVWTLPGGHLKVGETLAHGAQREGEEETGLALTLIGLVNWGEFIDQENLTRPVHFIYFDFCFRATEIVLHIDEREVVEAVWLRPHEALSRNLSPAYRETIQQYQRMAPADGQVICRVLGAVNLAPAATRTGE